MEGNSPMGAKPPPGKEMAQSRRAAQGAPLPSVRRAPPVFLRGHPWQSFRALRSLGSGGLGRCVSHSIRRSTATSGQSLHLPPYFFLTPPPKSPKSKPRKTTDWFLLSRLIRIHEIGVTKGAKMGIWDSTN